MITDGLRRQALERPNAPFLTIPGSSTTYAEMVALVDAAAERLRGLVAPGSRVMILCGNRPAFLVAWFAVNELGAVAVPVNTGVVGEALRYTADHSGAAVLLAESEFLNSRDAVLRSRFASEAVVVLDDTFERAASRVEAPPRLVAAPDEASAILFTSGTTGYPKGVVISHDSYRHAGIDMVKASGLTPTDRIMVFLPLFHANPQMYAVMSAMECGAELIVLPRFSAGSFFDDARTFGATAFTYVGTVLSMLAARQAGEVRDHGLRWCVGGGAPANVWSEIEARFGIAVRELYGMTETGGWVSMNTASSTRTGSVGRARDQVDLAIMDENQRVLPAMASGEIVARSHRPNLFFTEYWDDESATRETVRDGWLHTGDRGFIDEDGYLYFEGRIKDLIRRAGEMISPTEIEAALGAHPAVAECAVAGAPDPILGEEIVAAVVLQKPATPDDLLGFLKGRVAAYMIPRYIVLVDALPRTETTKVKRFEVARLLEGPSLNVVHDARESTKSRQQS